MALIYHELNIPLDTDSTFDYIVIKQGDAGSHKVRATLINNNSVFTIPTSNATYYFKFRKPDNTYVLVQATVSNNQIIADVTEEMLRVAGTGRGEFMIVQGSTELKTATFYFKIVQQTYTTDDVISSSDFATFARLLAGAGNAASNANEAAAAANTAAANAAAKADLIPDDYTALVQQVEDIQDELENLDVETDATLTEQGKPADAKATGDKIAELNGSLVQARSDITALNGSLAPVTSRHINLFDKDAYGIESGKRLKENGDGYTTDSRYLVSDYIPVDALSWYYIAGYSTTYDIRIGAFYSSDKSYLSEYNFYHITASTSTMVIAGKNVLAFKTPENAAYFRMSILAAQKDNVVICRSVDRFAYMYDFATMTEKYRDYSECELTPTASFSSVIDGIVKSEGYIEPKDTDFLEETGSYNILNIDGAFSNKIWSTTTFGAFSNYNGNYAYPPVRIELNATGKTYTCIYGTIINLAVWYLGDGIPTKLCSISTGDLSYSESLKRITISKSGVSNAHTNNEATAIADVDFASDVDEIYLLISGIPNTCVSDVAGATGYYAYGHKNIVLSDKYKTSIIRQIFAESDDLSEQIKRITRPLYGKTLICFGDSEMQYAFGYDIRVGANGANYHTISRYFDDLSISEYKTYAQAGNKWEPNDVTDTIENCETGIHRQLNNLLADINSGAVNKSDIGAIIWMMGTNCRDEGEFWQDEENHIINRDFNTMCGAAHLFMERILQEFTSADIRLLGIIPIQGKNRSEFVGDGLKTRHNKLRDIHRCWSIPFLDLNYEGEIYASSALNSEDNGTMGDIVHWSPLGAEICIRKIIGKLLTI